VPALLRKDSIRLIEAAIECLHLAVIGLGVPKVSRFRESSAQFAGEIGLIGSAAELLVGACLVQLSGLRVLFGPSGHYKSAAHIVDDFLSTLKDRPPRIAVLTKGAANSEALLSGITELCRKFKLLVVMRAGGLHAGRSPSREGCLAVADDVAKFARLLARSERFRPYLSWIPQPPEPAIERSALLATEQRRLEKSANTAERGALASQIFLLLPDLPPDAPEWLEAFERVTLAPQEEDIAVLLKTLEQAVPFTLRKSKQGGPPLSVVVKASDQSAIPIAPQYLRTEFTQAPDRFYADVGTANGRLNDGFLDLPPETFVKELFATGFEGPGILTSGAALTAHQAWPFVGASLAVQGTPGPLWFVVRKTGDVGQLIALLEKAQACAKPGVSGRISAVFPGIIAIRDGTSLPLSPPWQELLALGESIEDKRVDLAYKVALSEQAGRRLSPTMEAAVLQLAENSEPIGPVLLELADSKVALDRAVRAYWARIVSESASQLEDAPGLLAVLRNNDCGAAHTAAKKAMRYIDFAFYGPTVATS
jgi:hypothetical protein